MSRTRIIRFSIIGLVLAGLAAGGGAWWMRKQRVETTDNAYVQADTAPVTALIEGNVAEILVADNQSVTVGQLLVRLDPFEAQARLAEAAAMVSAQEAEVRAVDDKAALEKALIEERAAAVVSAEAAAERARLDLDRYASLAKDGWVSQQRLQEQRATAGQAAAAVVQAKAALEAERRTAASLGSAKAQNLAEVDAAASAVGKARIDVDRTLIRAPVAGVVGARSVRAGQYVRPGANLMSIVPLDQTYVIANFKETQVARLRIGQRVQIRADAFGGKVIKGRIESFSPATGAEFALIPVENAVGNFTKITQRLPVRIAVDRNGPGVGLRPGLSVKVTVDVRANTGPSFADSAEADHRLARQGAAR